MRGGIAAEISAGGESENAHLFKAHRAHLANRAGCVRERCAAIAGLYAVVQHVCAYARAIQHFGNRIALVRRLHFIAAARQHHDRAAAARRAEFLDTRLFLVGGCVCIRRNAFPQCYCSIHILPSQSIKAADSYRKGDRISNPASFWIPRAFPLWSLRT